MQGLCCPENTGAGLASEAFYFVGYISGFSEIWINPDFAVEHLTC